MREVFSKTAFQIGEEIFVWKDVIEALQVLDEWEELENRVIRAAACRLKWEQADCDPPVDLDSGITEFRYQRNLITVEEFESWLAARGLVLDELLLYVEDEALTKMWSAELEEILREHRPDNDGLQKSFEIHGLCSGKFQSMGEEFAGRAALYHSQHGPTNATGSERKRKIERGYDLFRIENATEQVIDQQIQSWGMDFIRFHLIETIFSQESGASEAALCIREDGMTMQEVAADANIQANERELYFFEADEQLQSLILSAKTGELIGPIRLTAGNFALYQVLDKIMPTGEDKEIRRKAEQRYLNSILTQERNNRVKWFTTL